MHASQESPACSSIGSFYRQPIQKNDPCWLSNFQVLKTDSRGSGPCHVFTEQFFTLESTPAAIHIIHNSPSAAIPSPSMCTFSPQLWNSYISQVTRSSENAYQSPSSGSGRVDEESNLIPALWMVRNGLLGSKFDTHSRGSFNGVVAQPSPLGRCNRNMEITPPMDLKQLLISIAETVSAAGSLSLSDRNVAASAAEALMNLLEKWVSISGEPLQRLGAYMLEGLRARLLSTGNIIYKKLKCNQPTSSELMSYMHVLFQICPYWKFAYTSANAVTEEAMECENRTHVIDFQIAQGSQWISFIHSLSLRPGRRLSFRLTGVDDSQSAHARGGGLQMISQRLAEVAESCGVPFIFHVAAMSGCEIKPENLHIQPGEALAVNFPYVRHHMPDESVSTTNHRDCLLRLVKSLSPKVVVLVEQESNTNTSPFFQGFCETLDYYTAIFESIDAAHLKDEKMRISAEEHCVARDIVNILACEGTERVERHELFGKWKMRLTMAGFSPVPLSSSVNNAIKDMLKEYSPNYRTVEGNGALFLGWKNRALVTSSAWR